MWAGSAPLLESESPWERPFFPRNIFVKLTQQALDERFLRELILAEVPRGFSPSAPAAAPGYYSPASAFFAAAGC